MLAQEYIYLHPPTFCSRVCMCASPLQVPAYAIRLYLMRLQLRGRTDLLGTEAMSTRRKQELNFVLPRHVTALAIALDRRHNPEP
jgi:hypothetical protein